MAGPGSVPTSRPGVVNQPEIPPIEPASAKPAAPPAAKKEPRAADTMVAGVPPDAVRPTPDPLLPAATSEQTTLPKSQLECSDRIMTLQQDIGALVAQKPQSKEEEVRLSGALEGKQKELSRLMTLLPLFDLGTPVSNAPALTREEAAAELGDDKRLGGALERLYSKQDGLRSALQKLGIFIPQSIDKRPLAERLEVSHEEVATFLATGELSERMATLFAEAKTPPEKKYGAQFQAYSDRAYFAQFIWKVADYKLKSERKELDAEAGRIRADRHLSAPAKKEQLQAVADKRAALDLRIKSAGVAYAPVQQAVARNLAEWKQAVAGDVHRHLVKATRAKDPAVAERYAKLADKQSGVLVRQYRAEAKSYERIGKPKAAAAALVKSAQMNLTRADAQILRAEPLVAPKPLEVKALVEAEKDVAKAKTLAPGAAVDFVSAKVERKKASVADTWLKSNGYDDALPDAARKTLEEKKAQAKAAVETTAKSQKLDDDHLAIEISKAEAKVASDFYTEHREKTFATLPDAKREEAAAVLGLRLGANQNALLDLTSAWNGLKKTTTPADEALKLDVGKLYTEQAAVVIAEQGSLARALRYEKPMSTPSLPPDVELLTVASAKQDLALAMVDLERARSSSESAWVFKAEPARQLRMASDRVEIATARLALATAVRDGLATPLFVADQQKKIAERELSINKVEQEGVLDVVYVGDAEKKKLAILEQQAKQTVAPSKAADIGAGVWLAIQERAARQALPSHPDIDALEREVPIKLAEIRSFALTTGLPVASKLQLLGSLVASEQAFDRHLEANVGAIVGYQRFLSEKTEARDKLAKQQKTEIEALRSSIEIDKGIDRAITYSVLPSLVSPGALFLSGELNHPDAPTVTAAQWLFDTHIAEDKLRAAVGARARTDTAMAKDGKLGAELTAKLDVLAERRLAITRGAGLTIDGFEKTTEGMPRGGERDGALLSLTALRGSYSEMLAGNALGADAVLQLDVAAAAAKKIEGKDEQVTATFLLAASAYRTTDKLFAGAARGSVSRDGKLAITGTQVEAAGLLAAKLRAQAASDKKAVGEASPSLVSAEKGAETAAGATATRRRKMELMLVAYRDTVQRRAAEARTALAFGQLQSDKLTSDSAHPLGKLLSLWLNEKLLWEMNAKQREACEVSIEIARERATLGIEAIREGYDLAKAQGGAAGDAYLSMVLASVSARGDAKYEAFNAAEAQLIKLGGSALTIDQAMTEQQKTALAERENQQIPTWVRKFPFFGSGDLIVRARLGSRLFEATLALQDDPIAKEFARSGAFTDADAAMRLVAGFSGLSSGMARGAEGFQGINEFYQRNMKAIMLSQEGLVLLLSVALPMAAPVALGGEALEAATWAQRTLALMQASPRISTLLQLGNIERAAMISRILRVGWGGVHMASWMGAQKLASDALTPVIGADRARALTSLLQVMQLGQMATMSRGAKAGAELRQLANAAMIPVADFAIRNVIIASIRDPKRQHAAEIWMDRAMLLVPGVYGEITRYTQARAAVGEMKAQALERLRENPGDAMAKALLGDTPAAAALSKQLVAYYTLHQSSHLPTEKQLVEHLQLLERSMQTGQLPAEVWDTIRAGQTADWAVSIAAKELKVDLAAGKGLTPENVAKIEARVQAELAKLTPPLAEGEAQLHAQMRLQLVFAKALEAAADPTVFADKLAQTYDGKVPSEQSGLNTYGMYSQLGARVGLKGKALDAFVKRAGERYLGKEIARHAEVDGLTAQDIAKLATAIGGVDPKATPKAACDAMALTPDFKTLPEAAQKKLLAELGRTLALDRHIEAMGEALNAAGAKGQIDIEAFDKKESAALTQLLRDLKEVGTPPAQLERTLERVSEFSAGRRAQIESASTAQFKKTLLEAAKAAGMELTQTTIDAALKGHAKSVVELELREGWLKDAATPPLEKVTARFMAELGLDKAAAEALAKVTYERVTGLPADTPPAMEAAAKAMTEPRKALTALASELAEGKIEEATASKKIAVAIHDLVKALQNAVSEHKRIEQAIDAQVDAGTLTKEQAMAQKGKFRLPAQAAAQLRFLEQFSSIDGVESKGFATRLQGKGVIAAEVRGVSPRVLVALSEMFGGPHSSIDPFGGAANVEHLATVFAGALTSAREKKGSPLTQSEVDWVCMQTVPTDATGKGRNPGPISTMETAPLLSHDIPPRQLGNTGRGFLTEMYMRDVLRRWPEDLPRSEKLKDALRTLVGEASEYKPSKEAIAKAKERFKLSDEEALHLVRATTELIDGAPAMASVYTQPWLAGTYLHGIPAFKTIARSVAVAGGDHARAQQIYECVLGHHMAGFVANGFSHAGVRLDFDVMVKRGELSKEGAAKLKALYDAAIPLAGVWRGVIDGTLKGARSLSKEQRAEYFTAAEGLRKAISNLPDHVRAQLINDDSQQFSPVGLPKWVGMVHETNRTSNGVWVETLYKQFMQPYFEENMARGSGDGFQKGTALAAERLGMTYDAEGKFFRPATEGEPAYKKLAAQLEADLLLREAFVKEKGADALTPKAIVEWFRNERPPSAADISRIADLDPTQAKAEVARVDAPSIMPPSKGPSAALPIQPRLVTAEEIRFAEFQPYARAMGLKDPIEIREAFALAGGADRDSIFTGTGLPTVYRSADLRPSLEGLLPTIGKPGGPVSAFVISADLFNLAGLNQSGGATEATRLMVGGFSATDLALKSAIEANGGKLTHFRGRGGEMITVVTFNSGDVETHAGLVAKSVENAVTASTKYFAGTKILVKEKKLDVAEVVNPKVSEADGLTYGGSRIDMGFVRVTAADTLDGAIGRAVTARQVASPKIPEAAKYDGPPLKERKTNAPQVEFDWRNEPVGEPSAGTDEAGSFLSVDLKRRALRGYVGARGGKAEGANTAFALYESRDTVTGMHVAEERVGSLVALIGRLKEVVGSVGFYGEADIGNLGGMTTLIGRARADAVFRRMSRIYMEKVTKAVTDAGGEVHFFRKGGDEICCEIYLPPSKDKKTAAERLIKIKAAMVDAENQVRQFVDGAVIKMDDGSSINLRDIVHPKRHTEIGSQGSRLSFGVTEVNPDATLDKNFSLADLIVEAKKKRPTLQQVREGIAERAGVPQENRAACAQELLKLHIDQADERKKIPVADLKRKQAAIFLKYGGHPALIQQINDPHGLLPTKTSTSLLEGLPVEGFAPGAQKALRSLAYGERDTLLRELKRFPELVPLLDQHPEMTPMFALIGATSMRSLLAGETKPSEALKFIRSLGRDAWTMAEGSPFAVRDLWLMQKGSVNVLDLVRTNGFGPTVLALRRPVTGEEVTKHTNVRVGPLLATHEQATTLLRRITSGDRAVFGELGVKPPPSPGFETDQIEWGLGRTPDGKFMLIRGERGAVDWRGFPGLYPMGHSHPLWPEKRLGKPIAFAELFLQANEKKMIDVLASGGDLGFLGERGIKGHIVHTPYVVLKDGTIGDPTPNSNGKEPRLDIVVESSTPMADSQYHAKITARSTNGEIVWQGDLFGLAQWNRVGAVPFFSKEKP